MGFIEHGVLAILLGLVPVETICRLTVAISSFVRKEYKARARAVYYKLLTNIQPPYDLVKLLPDFEFLARAYPPLQPSICLSFPI
jgi:hypothetical protein